MCWVSTSPTGMSVCLLRTMATAPTVPCTLPQGSIGNCVELLLGGFPPRALNALWQTTGVGWQDRHAVLCFLFGHTTGMVPPRTLLARDRTCHFAMEDGLKCATTQC
jgi:hypothetical protein